MMCILTKWIGCLLGLTLQAHAQLRVLAPDWLVRDLPDSTGMIQGSTATFGAPFYGDRILGQLSWGESKKGRLHCRDDDYYIPPLNSTMRGNSGYNQVRLINIIMVRRGKCSFTTKVRVAYEKGAHAVIIVDSEDSEVTSQGIQNVIMSDDGFGHSIRIPSVLIAKEEGNRLINAAKISKVIVELAWDVPTNHVVNTDLWMSSGSRASLKFLKEFSPNRKVLNEVVIFQPHYIVFSMDYLNPSIYESLCIDKNAQYCAEDPDGPGPITGREVLEEDVRQLCIHEMSKVSRTSLIEFALGKPMVEYAAKYWDYIERLLDRCPLNAEHSEDRFGAECSKRLMQDVGLDVNAVQHCMETTKEKKLQHERENTAWSSRALRINGWRYKGIMSADLVTRAICSGFIDQPKECKTIIKPRDPFKPYTGSEEVNISHGVLFALLLVIVVLIFGSLCVYKQYLKNHMRVTLREEVMLEVQAQIGDYNKLQGHP